MYPPSPFKWTPSIQHLHPDCTDCTALCTLQSALWSQWRLLCLSFKGPPLAALCPGYPVARSVTRAMISNQLSHVGWGHCQCCLARVRVRVTPARGAQLRTLPATCSDPGPPLEQGCAGRGLWLAPGGRWSQLLPQLSYFKMKLLLRLLVVVMPSPGLGKLA